MSTALALFLLALPSLLIGAAFWEWRDAERAFRMSVLLVLAVSWAVSGWFWLSYSQQQDDVGLMFHGILAMATGVSALCATLVAIFFWWRRRNP